MLFSKKGILNRAIRFDCHIFTKGPVEYTISKRSILHRACGICFFRKRAYYTGPLEYAFVEKGHIKQVYSF